MKQCPNPNCTIYTSLDELPDTYVKCPLCKETLVEVPPRTGALQSSHLEDEITFPNVPVSKRTYVQPPLYDRSAYHDYSDVAPDEIAEESDPPGESFAPQQSRLRIITVSLGILALFVACGALALGVSSRFFPQQPSFSSAVATQNAISQFRPPVNTPIIILPTIPLSGGQFPGTIAPVAQPAAASTPGPAVQPPAPDPGSPAPIIDALMCARLEGGQPVGPTSAYNPTDQFNLALQAAFGAGGAVTVLTRWYGPDGAAIYELKQNYTQQGTYYSGFTVSKKGAWAVGDYRVDIYTNNSPQPIQSVTFSVIAR